MKKMWVYVAGKFEHKAAVRAIQASVQDRGHTITHDWTQEDLGSRTGLAAHSYLRECAKADVEGVINADVIILLNNPNGFGLMVELGVAIAKNIPVIVVAPELRDTPFFHLPLVIAVDTPSEALKILDRMAEDKDA